MLPKAGVNRVYNASALRLTGAELGFLMRSLFGDGLGSVEPVVLGGVDYVAFEASEPLDEAMLAVLSNVSTLHALFELDGDRLRPVDIRPHELWDDDILTI